MDQRYQREIRRGNQRLHQIARTKVYLQRRDQQAPKPERGIQADPPGRTGLLDGVLRSKPIILFEQSSQAIHQGGKQPT